MHPPAMLCPACGQGCLSPVVLEIDAQGEDQVVTLTALKCPCGEGIIEESEFRRALLALTE